jgi:hypothetical protein
MSLCMSWSTFRPGVPVRPCPQCGAADESAWVEIRHEHARFAGHAPAWVLCNQCRRWYAGGIATGEDCHALRR